MNPTRLPTYSSWGHVGARTLRIATDAAQEQIRELRREIELNKLVMVIAQMDKQAEVNP